MVLAGKAPAHLLTPGVSICYAGQERGHNFLLWSRQSERRNLPAQGAAAF